MKFDDNIYREITWFNASEIVEHDTFDGIDSYELLRNLATLEAGYSLDGELDEGADERVWRGREQYYHRWPFSVRFSACRGAG